MAGIWNWVAGGAPALQFDYWWTSTRIIPNTINEFPFFSFLFADLHPHLMAMPLGLLILALCGLLLQDAEARASRRVSVVVLLALTLGAVGITNTWDLPIYVLISAAVLIYLGCRRHGARGGLCGVGLALGLGLSAILAYAPFYEHYRAQHLGIGWVPAAERTQVGPFLLIWGLQLWLLAGALGCRVSRVWKQHASARWPVAGPTLGVFGVGGVGALLVWAADGAVWPGLVFLLVVSVAACISLWQRPRLWFAWLLAVAGLGLLAGVEWLYVADFLRNTEMRRMNTVFKLSMPAWVLLGISLGAMLPLLWRVEARRARRSYLWQAGLAVLLLGALVYPVAATPRRVAERFPSGSPPRNTLDGTAYMTHAVYDAPGGSAPVEMKYDREALEWIWEHVQGTPVLAEAPVDYYREGGTRITSYTGLPTLVGAHQYEQRPVEQVAPREADAQRLFASTDPDEALQILDRYQVRLVYVGSLERALYDPPALAKFETLVQRGQLERIYHNAQVDLYRRAGDAASAGEGAAG